MYPFSGKILAFCDFSGASNSALSNQKVCLRDAFFSSLSAKEIERPSRSTDGQLPAVSFWDIRYLQFLHQFVTVARYQRWSVSSVSNALSSVFARYIQCLGIFVNVDRTLTDKAKNSWRS